MSTIVLELDAETYNLIRSELQRGMTECATLECHYQNDVRRFYFRRHETLRRAFKHFQRKAR